MSHFHLDLECSTAPNRLLLRAASRHSDHMTAAPLAAPTLDHLTLSDILSDLNRDKGNSLSSLPAATAPRSAIESVGFATAPDLSLFSALGSSSSSSQSAVTDYVSLSRQIRVSFNEAQRLNSEPVSTEQIALLLPSERGKSWARCVTNAPKATRTDLLHAKVAALQTQIDDWDQALRSALTVVNAPASSSTPSIPEPARSVTSTSESETLSKPEAQSERVNVASSSKPVSVPISNPDLPEFEDDDPWNDLS